MIPTSEDHDATFVGLATLDVVHRVPQPVGPDEKVTALRQDLAAGGPAANAAAAFAALGGSARLITALGGHVLARAASDDLRERGVVVLDAAEGRTAPPPVSAVRVIDGTGERSVSSVKDTDIDVPPAAQVPPLGGLLVLDGWYRDLALHAASAASEAGVPTILGAGSWRPLVAELLPSCGVLVTSGAFPRDRIPPGKPFVRTIGERPVQWRDLAGREGMTPVPRVNARDTLGAGDTFLGAFAFALARGADIPEAVGFAVTAATTRVEYVGISEGQRAAAAAMRRRAVD